MNDLYFMIILYLEKDVYSFESSRKSSDGSTRLSLRNDVFAISRYNFLRNSMHSTDCHSPASAEAIIVGLLKE